MQSSAAPTAEQFVHSELSGGGRSSSTATLECLQGGKHVMQGVLAQGLREAHGPARCGPRVFGCGALTTRSGSAARRTGATVHGSGAPAWRGRTTRGLAFGCCTGRSARRVEVGERTCRENNTIKEIVKYGALHFINIISRVLCCTCTIPR